MPADPTSSAVAPLAETVAGDGRPASVPPQFVVTPFGYLDPSCVIEVASGDEVLEDATVVHADGTIRAIGRCAHPRYDRAGNVIHVEATTAGESPPPKVDGWVSAAHDNQAHGPWRHVSANWTVPQPPAIRGNQVLYMFPGVQATAILQPVLGWNHIRQIEGWSIASWNCCKDGNAVHSPLIAVNSGDELAGGATALNCDAITGVCSRWHVFTHDGTTFQDTDMITTSYGEVENWLFGGALEAYDVEHCAQYPANGYVSFTNISRTTVNRDAPPFPWTNSVYNVSPSCAYDVSTPDAKTATLSWAPTMRPKPTQVDGCRNVYTGYGVIPGGHVVSCNGKFIMNMQLDGNLVLYNRNSDGTLGPPVWATNTDGNTRAFDAVMQSDGNFVLYDMFGNPLWATGTWGHPGAYFAVQDDGNLVVYGADGAVLWYR